MAQVPGIFNAAQFFGKYFVKVRINNFKFRSATCYDADEENFYQQVRSVIGILNFTVHE